MALFKTHEWFTLDWDQLLMREIEAPAKFDQCDEVLAPDFALSIEEILTLEENEEFKHSIYQDLERNPITNWDEEF